jgi:hypothetical protein
MAKLKSKDDPEWSSWKSSRLGHDEVAENNAKQKPCTAKQSGAEEVFGNVFVQCPIQKNAILLFVGWCLTIWYFFTGFVKSV